MLGVVVGSGKLRGIRRRSKGEYLFFVRDGS